MASKDLADDKNYFEKLPDIVLIPWHYKIERVPSYPYCGKREIFCGPKLQNKDSIERKFIRTNGRFFEIDEVLSQLDENDQKIDLIFSHLEAPSTCFPKNLSKIKCPKIALVGDTHHLLYSISSIIHYIKHENYEHMLTASQSAHLHYFYEAGMKHAAFLPRVAEKFESINNKKAGITYIGKRWGTSHPRRSRMVYFLEKKLPKKNIPFYRYNRLPKFEYLNVLRNSRIVVISSLNGQLTPQIYYCLVAGTLCFVDELSSQTLLYQFFEPGKHLVTWRNFEDLLEKLIYYYNHPDEAEAIAKAGKLQVENNFATSDSMGSIISDFVFKNKIDPRFLAINDARCQQKRVESPEYFYARIRLYENIQELHRIHESLKLISLTEKNLKPLADLADLPRLNITHAFISDILKKEADLYFQSVGVSHQIRTTILDKTQKLRSYDIGILETLTNQTNWRFLVKSISNLLKKNAVIWVLGKLSSSDIEILQREGFKPFVLNKNPTALKIKNISRKICLLFWKTGMYPFPYITLKPAMETVPNLKVFLRGWQAKFQIFY